MWHPSTLLPKQCYQDYSKIFSSRMLYFAKQTLEIHSTLNADMKVPPALNTAFPARFWWYKAKISSSCCSKWSWSRTSLHQWILPLIWKVGFHLSCPRLSGSPFNSELSFTLSTVLCSFDESGLHQMWRQDEQFDYCGQTREKAGCVSTHWKASWFGVNLHIQFLFRCVSHIGCICLLLLHYWINLLLLILF